jgi:hypothetical protein
LNFFNDFDERCIVFFNFIVKNGPGIDSLAS